MMTHNAADVVKTDLDYIVSNLGEELTEISGKNLLITGGAGFLGHYLVQTIVHWNRHARGNHAIRLTVYDNISWSCSRSGGINE